MIRLSRQRVAHAAIRLLAIAALGGFLGAVLGVPVVRLAPKKDLSQPFPCQDHRCGCMSADQCWQSCCCFTNREKLAWAAEHGVRPPAYVFAAAAREKPVALTQSCCHSHSKSCCDDDASCCEKDESAESHTWSIEFVSAIQARKCRGQAELWLALGAVAPPPAAVAVSVELLRGDILVVAAESIVGISHPPVAPPPRA